MITAQPRRRARPIRRFPGRIGTATPNSLLDTWDELTPPYDGPGRSSQAGRDELPRGEARRLR